MFPFVRDLRDGDGPVEQTRAEDGRPEVERAPADPVQNGSVQPAGRQRVLGTGQHQGGGRRLWTARGWWMFGPESCVRPYYVSRIVNEPLPHIGPTPNGFPRPVGSPTRLYVCALFLDSNQPVQSAQRQCADQLSVQHGHVQQKRTETSAKGQQIGRAHVAPETSHDYRDKNGSLSQISNRYFRAGNQFPGQMRYTSFPLPLLFALPYLLHKILLWRRRRQ